MIKTNLQLYYINLIYCCSLIFLGIYFAELGKSKTFPLNAL